MAKLIGWQISDTPVWHESLTIMETSAPKAIRKAAPSISGLSGDQKSILFECLWGMFQLIIMSWQHQRAWDNAQPIGLLKTFMLKRSQGKIKDW